MIRPLSLSDEQMEMVTVAALTLRVGSRCGFLQGVAKQLQHTSPPSDTDVATAISRTLGMEPGQVTQGENR
jgi:hypothetical protein